MIIKVKRDFHFCGNSKNDLLSDVDNYFETRCM